jgi:hypothetical protein
MKLEELRQLLIENHTTSLGGIVETPGAPTGTGATVLALVYIGDSIRLAGSFIGKCIIEKTKA